MAVNRSPMRQMGRITGVTGIERLGRHMSDPPSACGTVAEPGGKARLSVQPQSTATGVDLTGLVCTLWDGDLRR
jgi:hypothetical protein